MKNREKTTLRRMRTKLEDEGQRLVIDRNPRALAPFIVVAAHTGNPEAWPDSLAEWSSELGVAS